jgi:hypothetical protein
VGSFARGVPKRWHGELKLNPDLLGDSDINVSSTTVGQAGVDKGGWKRAEEQEHNGITYIRYEFTSAGRFRYIDYLEIRVDDKGTISVKTASREGGFDYGVNAARIKYIQALLKEKGWKVEMVQ